MYTTVVDKDTLPTILELGNRIASDVDKLENLIWLVKAQAVKQLAEATRAFNKAYEKNAPTVELAEAVRIASERFITLEKFWNEERAMRNRAVQFGGLDERKVRGWLALEAVMKIVVETKGSAPTSDRE